MEAIYPLMAVAGFSSQFLSSFKDDNDNIPAWDWTHDYYVFPADYTYIIDNILASPYGLMTQKIIMSENKRIPAVGYHYYYNVKTDERTFIDTHFRYITFVKTRKTISNEVIVSYRCIVGGLLAWQKEELLASIVTKIFRTDSDTIRTISIDTSSHLIKPIYMTEKYDTPRSYQKNAANLIINSYKTNKHHNTKYIISGKRGTGKTFTARVIKKMYEKQNPSHIVKLFSDFDPTVVGVNVNNIILAEASSISPVIIVINEIDEVYKYIFSDKQIFDSRILHTKTMGSFTNMMDAINNTPYVFFIGTTELPLSELYSNPDYHSLMRFGRIDHFIEMSRTNNSAKLIKHEDIEGFPLDDSLKLKIL